MPYKRYTRRKRTYRKKPYVKKAIYKKKRIMKRFSKYDGNHREKIVHSYDLLCTDDGADISNTYVTWVSNKGEDAGNRDIGMAASDEYTQCKAMYRYVRVTGLKIEVLPIGFIGTSFQGNKYIEIASDPYTQTYTTLNGPEIHERLDYKIYPAGGLTGNYIKRYYKVSKVRKDQPAFNNYSVSETGWWDSSATDPFMMGKTVIRFVGQAFAANQFMGRLRATWYTEWKTRN